MSNKKSRLQFSFLTLFPEVLECALGSSLLGKAQQSGLVTCQFIQIRDFGKGRHRQVDDAPYGGGEGMILAPDVLFAAWKKAVPRKPGTKKVATILLSPQGQLFDQTMAKELAQYSKLVFVCGHYEGVDERFVDLCVDREVSIGDYVLTGGEIPALVVADTVARLVPGVVGNAKSITEESLEGGLLKYPQYTRPRSFKGLDVPPVLLSGNHREIAAWRDAQRRERTRLKRPDLWAKLGR